MKVVKMTDSILSIGNGAFLMEEFADGFCEHVKTCAWPTDGEEHEIKNTCTDEYVCFLNDEGHLLMECIGNGSVSVPVVRKNGRAPNWKLSAARGLGKNRQIQNKAPTGAIKARAHGTLYQGWYYECAWFVPTACHMP